MESGALAVTWSGSSGAELRARYAIDDGQPVVRELAVRKSGGQWAPLGQNLVPEIYVKTGVRRMTRQQAAPLLNLGVDITPEVIEREKWYSFWDAPFVIRGVGEPQRARRGGAAAVSPDRPHRASRRRDAERSPPIRRDECTACRAGPKKSGRPMRRSRRPHAR